MTEHSKIPLPGSPGEAGESGGKSLFERAEGLIGKSGFAPAPVPRELAPPVNRPLNNKVARRAAPVTPHPNFSASACGSVAHCIEGDEERPLSGYPADKSNGGL